MTSDELKAANIISWQISDIETHIRDVHNFDVDSYFDADKYLGAPIYTYSGRVSRELMVRHKQEVIDDLLNTLYLLTKELESL